MMVSPPGGEIHHLVGRKNLKLVIENSIIGLKAMEVQWISLSTLSDKARNRLKGGF